MKKYLIIFFLFFFSAAKSQLNFSNNLSAKTMQIYDSIKFRGVWYKAWGGGGGSGSAWDLFGNTGTNTTSNFIGTTNAVGLKFKVNNIQAGFIDYNLSNTSFGVYSLNSNTTGSSLVAFGTSALRLNTTGYGNTAIGTGALSANTIGSYNTAIGGNTLSFNINNIRNVAVGFDALNDGNSTGNTAVGVSSMANTNVNGPYNTAVGYSSLYAIQNGGYNIALGNYAGITLVNDSFKVFINSIDRSIGSGGVAAAIDRDTTLSIFYAHQNAVLALQRWRLNGRGVISGLTKYNAKYTIETNRDIPDVEAVDSLINKKLIDSSFSVSSPVATGVTLFNNVSSTNLQIKKIRAGSNVTITANGDSTVTIDAAAGGAPLNSPAFTGVPTAPTATNGTNTTQIATTAFTQNQLTQTLQDSAFDVVRPVVNGTVKAFEKISGQKLQISDFKNSYDISVVKGTDSTISFFTTVSSQSITAGSSTTITNGVKTVYIDPSSLLASHTITMPAIPTDQQVITFLFGGTVSANSTVITTLSFAPNSGQTIYQSITPTTAKGGDVVIYQYNLSTTKWYRIK